MQRPPYNIDLITIDEIANMLKVKKRTAYNLVCKEIPIIKISNKIIRVRMSDFEAYLERKKALPQVNKEGKPFRIRKKIKNTYIEDIVRKVKREVLATD